MILPMVSVAFLIENFFFRDHHHSSRTKAAIHIAACMTARSTPVGNTCLPIHENYDSEMAYVFYII